MVATSRVVVTVTGMGDNRLHWQHSFSSQWDEGDAGSFLQKMDSLGGYTGKLIRASMSTAHANVVVKDVWKISVRHGYMEVYVPSTLGGSEMESFRHWWDLLEGVVWRRQFLNSLQEEE